MHYFKFDLSDAAVAAIRAGTAAVAVVIDHPEQPIEKALPAATLQALAEDLAG